MILFTGNIQNRERAETGSRLGLGERRVSERFGFPSREETCLPEAVGRAVDLRSAQLRKDLLL